MKSARSACSLLLLTMVAFCSGRNATEYFQQARFQYSPDRPDDALAFFIGNVSFICEPENAPSCAATDPPDDGFCLSLPRAYSAYACSFEGNETIENNFKLMEQSVPRLFEFSGARDVQFSQMRLYCFNDSQLPDEYFRLRVQRPHEDHPVKCLLNNDFGMLYVRFPGYPTVFCQLGIGRGSYMIQGRYQFNLPGIADEPLKCVFRVYSELLLVDAHTEERLSQSLVSSLPSRMHGAHQRFVCSRRGTSNETVHFVLQVQRDVFYDCGFPDAAPRHQPPPGTGLTEDGIERQTVRDVGSILEIADQPLLSQ